MTQRQRVPAGVTATSAIAAALAWPLACAGATPALPAQAAASKPSVAAGPATAVVDACPKELVVNQSVATDVPGWTSVNRRESYPFARIAFYSGPPADDKRVVPAWENRTTTGLHDGWRLPKQPAGYWVQCQYANTTAVVARKLDDAITFCRADYDPRFATLVVKRWSCLPGPMPAPSTTSRDGRQKSRVAPPP